MFANSKTKNISNSNVVIDYLKGLIVSLLVSLGLVILFAFILKWLNLSESFVTPVTFVIKYLSVIFGSLIAVKGDSKGLLKGGMFGAVYTVFAFSVFSFLSKSFSVDVSTLLDFASSIILGAIVGIFKVNRN